MADLLSSDPPKGLPTTSRRRPSTWIIASIVVVIMLIPALVCGLYFGLRHAHAQYEATSISSDPNSVTSSTTTRNPTQTTATGSGSNSVASISTTNSPSSSPSATGTGSIGATSLNVDLGYSTYKGAQLSNGVTQWLGIRYAAPPIGDLRFKAPQDPVTDSSTYSANSYGAVCHSSPSSKLDTSTSEDCLFLNVFGPPLNTGKHPVFVFIQGGGFNTLSAPTLNGSSLVIASDKDVVVVTFNYRVGVYGFLASKEVQANGDLNTGLLDQRKLFQWVQKHISQFGGDPEQVTIGGASAGAAAVDLQMSAYGGRDDGLFQRAAAESQSFGAEATVEESQYQYTALVNRVACNTTSDTLACLRALDIKTLAEKNLFIPTPGGGGGNPVFMYSPVIDGTFIEDYTYNAFASGKFIKIPSIFGDDTNEGTIFTPTNIDTATQFHSFLKNNFVNLTSAQFTQIDTFYPKAEQFENKGSYWRTAANAYGDMRYICPGINISSSIASHGESSSYNYHWDVLTPANQVSGLGVTHTAESGSIWGTAGSPESALTPMIQAYWTSFIRSGDPNKYKLAGAPSWEPFTVGGMERLHFVNDVTQVGMESVPSDQKARCGYLSGIGPVLAQ